MMAAELVITGDVPKLGPAVDDHEFSIARKGYDRDEVEAYLAEIEANLCLLEEWAQRANAKLAIAEEKNRALADVDEATVAVFEAREQLLEQARLDAEKIKAEATDRARAEAEVVAAQIVAEAQQEARRIAEVAQKDARRIAKTASPTQESILAAARAEADRLMRNTRAEADRQIDEASARATGLRIVEPPEASREGPEVPDQSIGSASVARLIVEMEGLPVDLDAPSDGEVLADEASTESLSVSDDEGDDAMKQSRYQRRSAKLPRIGKDANEVRGVIERLRKTIHNA